MGDVHVVIKLNEGNRMLICKAYLRGVNDLASGETASTCEETVQRVWADIEEMLISQKDGET